MPDSVEEKLCAASLAWEKAVGVKHVVINQTQLKTLETATFATRQKIPMALYPNTTSEVRECIRVANEFLVPVYPVSGGRNWGLGSRVPAESECVLLDLHRMDRIIEFDDELGFVTIEPGVSFQQLAKFLVDQDSDHFLSVIGGPPEASVIGNYLERGDALGPKGERASNACASQIVLGTSEIVENGFASCTSSVVTALHRFGVGPSMEGLFNQSNFGVTTRLTVWLNRKPNFF